jgi:glycosyltransferase involved in cell wall biosynthesis
MDSHARPLVSVVLITHNCVAYLEQAIRSVLAQTWTHLELIVVDDGSTDETGLVVQRFDDPRLSYVRQDNAGPNFARNHGIRKARGDFIAFLDCDDWWLPLKLERQVARMIAQPELGLVYSLAVRVDESGAETDRFATNFEGRLLDRLLLGNCVCGSASSALVSRKALDKVGQFDQSLEFGEDWEYWIRVAAEFPIGCVPQFDVYLLSRLGSRGKQPRSMLEHSLQVVRISLARYVPGRPWFHARVIAQVYYGASQDFSALGLLRDARRAILSAIAHYPLEPAYYKRLVRLMWRRVGDAWIGA